MFKLSKSVKQRKQAGFTLVELSIVLVIVGLLFAAVVKGQEMVDVAKAEKLLNDIKNTEALIQKYATNKSRMPGDCDSDGIIDVAADGVIRDDSGNAARAALYDYTTTRSAYAAGATVASAIEGCAQISGVATATADNVGVNTWLNDLKLAGLVADSVPNRTYAKQVNEDFMFVGKVRDTSPASTATGSDYNAIVIHNIPQWMARHIATAINGSDARADRNRVRSLTRTPADTNGTYEATWDVTDADGTGSAAAANSHRNSMVSIVYYFDRIPATTL